MMFNSFSVSKLINDKIPGNLLAKISKNKESFQH